MCVDHKWSMIKKLYNEYCMFLLLIKNYQYMSCFTGRHSNRERYTTWPRKRNSTMGRLTLTSKGVVRERMKQNGAHPLQIAGSRLPDCSHACGSCTPCVLKIVSSLCSSLAQSEACPISYKCMCKNKYYPVP
jgi:hypothetical protein